MAIALKRQPRPALVVRFDRTTLRRAVTGWPGRPLVPAAWAVSLLVHGLTVGQLDLWTRSGVASPQEASRPIAVSLSVPYHAHPIDDPVVPDPATSQPTALPSESVVSPPPPDLPDRSALPLLAASPPPAAVDDPVPEAYASPPHRDVQSAPPIPPPSAEPPAALAACTASTPQPEAPVSASLSPYWLAMRSNLFAHLEWPMNRTDSALLDVRMRLYRGHPELVEREHLNSPHGRAVRRAFRLATRASGTPPPGTPPEAVMTIVFSNHNERTRPR